MMVAASTAQDDVPVVEEVVRREATVEIGGPPVVYVRAALLYGGAGRRPGRREPAVGQRLKHRVGETRPQGAIQELLGMLQRGGIQQQQFVRKEAAQVAQVLGTTSSAATVLNAAMPYSFYPQVGLAARFVAGRVVEWLVVLLPRREE